MFNITGRRRCRNRNIRASILKVETLEERLVLSNVSADPRYSKVMYQPLNGDTQYVITGSDNKTKISAFAFSEAAGDVVHITFSTDAPSWAAGWYITDPTGKLIKSPQFTATTSGIYIIRTGPSPDYNHVYSYTITVTGAEGKPKLVVDSPNNSHTFYITSYPQMPSITATLVGFVPDPLSPSTFTWNYSTQLSKVNYSAGPSVAYAKTTFKPVTITTSTQNLTTSFSPSFDGVIRGGQVTFQVTASIGGIQVKSENSENTILGKNPSVAQVKAYINSLPVPSNFPKNSGFDFHTILLKIAAQESRGLSTDPTIYHQFSDKPVNLGEPYFNGNGSGKSDGGAGIMQITTPAPIANDIWNWQANINSGMILFINKMNDFSLNYTKAYETNHDSSLAARIAALQHQRGLSSLAMAPLTNREMVLEAIRAYNGGYEFDPATDSKGVLIVTPTGPKSGVINWVENYGKNTKVPNYVNSVLNQVV